MRKKILLLAAVPFLLAGCGTTPSSTTTTSDVSQSSSVSSKSTQPVVQQYTIQFMDETGSLLHSQKYNENATPSYSYIKQNTAEWKYTVKGWSDTLGGTVLSTLPKVTKDASYYAVVEKTKQIYTIKFNSNGGTTVADEVKEYGTSINAPTQPTYPNHAFVCWCTDSGLSKSVSWPYVVNGNATLYAKWNESINIKGMISEMMKAKSQNPYSYIPDTMKDTNSANLVNPSSIEYDFANKTSVSSITYGGFGEQWHMVIDNIHESQRFYKVLTLCDTAITGSVTIFNNYFDNNPSSTSTNTEQTGYKAKIEYANKILKYTLLYKSTISLPLFGDITPQIDMEYNIESLEKTVRIQLNGNNAMKYTVSDNQYIFGIQYGVTSVSRKAYCQLNKNNNNEVEGHIYEYVQFKDKDLVPSCADFYIKNDYTSVVGNKASGMVGFKGYIDELYETNKGKLVSYEVREERTVSKVSVTFNTMWFNLNNTSGFNNIKAIENGNIGVYGDNNHDIYINDSSSILATKNMGISYTTKAASRRYDVELRKQYFYSYDSTSGEYTEHQTSIPMLFVQAEVLSDFSTDIHSKNSDINASITLASKYITKNQSDYSTLVDIFITNKDKVTGEAITTWIGSAAQI